MTLRQKQSKFASLLPRLIDYIYQNGYEVTLGDACATTGHKVNSFHYIRLAIDLNLFKNGKYLDKTEDHKFIGEYWESLDPCCSWGGHFDDGNHYSYGELNHD